MDLIGLTCLFYQGDVKEEGQTVPPVDTAQATKGGQHSLHHYDLTVEVPMREEAIDSTPTDITFCAAALQKHTRILGATANKRTGESIIIKKGPKRRHLSAQSGGAYMQI